MRLLAKAIGWADAGAPFALIAPGPHWRPKRTPEMPDVVNGKRMSAVDIANAAGVTTEMVSSYRRQMESRISNQGLIRSTSVAMTMSFVSTNM